MTDTKLSNVAQLISFFTKYGSGPGTHPASQVPRVRTSKLTAEQVSILNEFSIEHVGEAWVSVTHENIDYLMGLEEASPTDVVFDTFAGKSYTAKRNKYNRSRTKSRIGPASKQGTYSNTMRRELWLSLRVDPFTYDWDGQIQSAQHRLNALKLALLAGLAEGKLWIKIIVGNPPQFRDAMDKAKTRTKKNDDEVDSSLFDVSLIDRVALEHTGVVATPAQRSKERTNLIGIRGKVCETIRSRFEGADFAKTGKKYTSDQDEEISELLNGIELINFDLSDPEGKIVATVPGGDFSMLEYLCCRVYESEKSQTGKLDAPWTDVFSPSIVLSGLILESVREDVIETQLEAAKSLVDFTSLTPEQKADWELSKRAELEDVENPIEVDMEFVDMILKGLTTSMGTKDGGSGPFGTAFAEIASQRTTDRKSDAKWLYDPNSIAAMSAFVQLLKNVRNGEPDAKVWTVFKKTEGKGETKIPSPTYRNFGGRDVGFISKTKSKKDE